MASSYDRQTGNVRHTPGESMRHRRTACKNARIRRDGPQERPGPDGFSAVFAGGGGRPFQEGKLRWKWTCCQRPDRFCQTRVSSELLVTGLPESSSFCTSRT